MPVPLFLEARERGMDRDQRVYSHCVSFVFFVVDIPCVARLERKRGKHASGGPTERDEGVASPIIGPYPRQQDPTRS